MVIADSLRSHYSLMPFGWTARAISDLSSLNTFGYHSLRKALVSLQWSQSAVTALQFRISIHAARPDPGYGPFRRSFLSGLRDMNPCGSSSGGR